MFDLKRSVIVVCLAGLLPLTAVADTSFSGRAVRVLDGDTIDVLMLSNQQVRVRLANIDAPEKTQPYGQRSKQNLAELVAGKEVRVVATGQDQYGRQIGRVLVGSKEANVEQVRSGMAWVYERYNRDADLPSMQASAKSQQLGLWHDESPQAPWTYRHSK